MKLDVFNHILPKAYFERLVDIIPDRGMLERYPKLPTLWDLDAHLGMMDEFDDYSQVLSLANPPLEMLAGPDESPALALYSDSFFNELMELEPNIWKQFLLSL